MELFHDNGHLTDEGLQALLCEKLDELGRLEVAEHLAFCDECLVRYTALLEDDTLLEPEKPLKPGVLKRLRTRSWRVAIGRYATVAAAACLALVMWGVGTFALPRTDRTQQEAQDRQPAGQSLEKVMEKETEGWSSRFSRMLDNTATGVNDFLDHLLNPGPEADAATTEDDRDDTGQTGNSRARRGGPGSGRSTAGEDDSTPAENDEK